MIAYKGFAPGLICRGYQFHVGLNTTEEANCAQNGFHCALNPLDCLSYYPDMSKAEYWLVDAGGDVDEDAHDSKISCTELTILRRLSLKDFVVHALAYMHDHPLLEVNRQYVESDFGVAKNGFVIVRGVDPRAKGKVGDIVAMAKENPANGRIEQIAYAEVDGSSTLPGIWYDVEFHRCGSPMPARSA